jgi:alpha-L-fucosidase
MPNQIYKKFEGTQKSLSTQQCPEWFRDAKFGIYCHWGPQSVPMCDGWYARNMYVQGHRVYKYHLKHFGHPSKFGFKDIIPLWTAEKFKPEELVTLFKEAGAKYFTPVAVHHDNFDLWNSKHTRWNAVKMGPKKDIIGLWRSAALKYGLIFGVTTHLSRSYSWMQLSHHSDKSGPLAGVSYDGEDSTFQDYYFKKHEDDNFRAPLHPPQAWKDEWKARMKDLIDNYHPQLLYFDAACPFPHEDQGQTGMEIIAHFYNDNLQQTDNASNGVQFIKKITDHGTFIENICLIDYEGHAQSDLDAAPWQTDISIGDWFYRVPDLYKTASKIIWSLVDIVSKNGNLLLNIPPKPDGTLHPHIIRILHEIGRWIHINGEAIYETRPWKQAAENKFRFTQKKGILYIFRPPLVFGKITINCLGLKQNPQIIDSIENLKTKSQMKFSQTEAKLTINLPILANCKETIVLKVKFK